MLPAREAASESACAAVVAKAVVAKAVVERVELELPPITIEKDYCRLTVEQASLYQATVDRWMPRIEEQRDSFGQRGSVLAMLSQLKRVCNHPELLLDRFVRWAPAASSPVSLATSEAGSGMSAGLCNSRWLP